MTRSSHSPSAEFLDGISATVRTTLDALVRQENDLAAASGSASNHDELWSAALARLEDNLGHWQTILDSMADAVRTAQDDLAVLDADLNRSLDAFAAARKHLQGA